MSKSLNRNTLLAIITFTVFLDMLGVAIIIPVLPALFAEAGAPFHGLFDVKTESMIYGLLIGSFSIMQFIGAPIWGALSDKHGRKPILTLTMVGAFFGYLISGYAILTGSLWLLFIGRMIPGFMGGNLAVIYSSIADISEEKDRTKNFGLVGAAFGLGFIAGPSIGGILAAEFSHAMPLWFTAGLIFVDVLMIRVLFPETLKTRNNKSISAIQGIENVLRIFKLPNLRGILIFVLLISLGFTFYTQFFALFLIRDHHFSVKEAGYLFGWVGLWLVITQAGIVRYLSKRYTSEQILKYTPFFMAVTVFLVLLPTEHWQFYLVNPLIAIAYGITSPNMTSMVSSNATAEQQGEVLGINQSMSSLGRVIPPLIGGYLAGLNSGFPILTGAIMLLAAWLVFLFFYRKK